MIWGIIIFCIGAFMASQNTQSKVAWPLIVVGLVLIVVPARAHDHGRPELDGWFKGLQSKAKNPCCDGSDATRLDDVDWESKDGRYRVRIEGEWVDVPNDALVGEPNRAGPTMVWPTWKDGQRAVRCFMPGVMI